MKEHLTPPSRRALKMPTTGGEPDPCWPFWQSVTCSGNALAWTSTGPACPNGVVTQGTRISSSASLGTESGRN